MERFSPHLREDRKSQSVFQKKLAQRGYSDVRSHGHTGSEPGRRPRSDPFPISPYHGASRSPKSLKPAVPSALHLPRISIPPRFPHWREHQCLVSQAGLTHQHQLPPKQRRGNGGDVTLWRSVGYLLWLLKLGLDFFKTLSAQACLSPPVLLRSETRELRCPTIPCLCRTINKAEKATWSRIWGDGWLCVQLTGESQPSSGNWIDVGCCGFLILYVFGWQNARNSLAEQVYPFFFSNQALVYWGMSLRNSPSGLLPEQHTVQWDSLNLERILSLKIHCALCGKRIRLWLGNGGTWTFNYHNWGQSLEGHDPSSAHITREDERDGVFAEYPLHATGDSVPVYWGENWRSQKENNLAKSTH